MIFDNLSNLRLYYGSNKNLDTIIEFIENNDLNALPLGKSIINDEVFVVVFDYETIHNDEWLFEKHHHYADIHLTLKGKEYVGVTSNDRILITKEYDEANDILFGSSKEYLKVLIDENHFVLTYAKDPHSPRNYAGDKQVKKVVFKFLQNK